MRADPSTNDDGLRQYLNLKHLLKNIVTVCVTSSDAVKIKC